MKPARRIAIDTISPDVDNGRFLAKGIADWPTRVSADIVCDGHEVLVCSLHYRGPHQESWTTIPLTNAGNDRWETSFTPDQLGIWEYTVSGGVDKFQTWLRDLKQRFDAGDDLHGELAEGQRLVETVLLKTPTQHTKQLRQFHASLIGPDGYAAACSPHLAYLMAAYADRSEDTWLNTPRRMCVERKRAAFGSWYEAFPRSWGTAGKHGTLRDIANSADYIASMGFDVLTFHRFIRLERRSVRAKIIPLQLSPMMSEAHGPLGHLKGVTSIFIPNLALLLTLNSFMRNCLSKVWKSRSILHCNVHLTTLG